MKTQTLIQQPSRPLLTRSAPSGVVGADYNTLTTDFSSSSTSFTAMMTTNYGKRLGVESDLVIFANAATVVETTTGDGWGAIFVAGSQITGSLGGGHGHNASTHAKQMNLVCNAVVEGLTAGTKAVTFRVKNDTGTTLYCRASSRVGFEGATLVILELLKRA